MGFHPRTSRVPWVRFQVKFWEGTPPKTNGWIPKMMVWKRWFLLNMAIFGIYVRFLGGSFYPPCYPLDQVATRVLHDWDLPRRGCPENEGPRIIFGSRKNSPRNSEDMWVFPKIGVLQNGWWKQWKTLLKWMIWGEKKRIFGNTHVSSTPSHVFFFDLFNILCFFRSVYHHIPRRFLAGVSFLEPASVTRYPRSSMLLAWLVLRETVLVFFGLLFLLAGFFWVKKNSLLFWRWSMLYLS